MDYINKAIGSHHPGGQQQPPQGQQAQPSGSGNLMGRLQGMAGGGPQGEKHEDALDKGIDWVQEHVFKQGPQSNESAAEQAKDKFIAQNVREQYQKATGKEFPVKEKRG
ncbi:e4c4ceb0-a765-498c-99c5-6538e9a62e0e [Thermothielavioides terrestris]|uniref:Uncharacterized protein n=2 Tax=Thermothielavioides terrestris TaxID=2587410 RepID=G2R1R0_THETT|nr:uncharacterized protein THITE_2114794 [Thermothielavioides terrestris NRRL 8126]AEO66602.1 hypothetical protein THITE_2114794 [Thermothielavioides terrestris NRRL 8126]SPQ20167.1 e4c4ceb0-a765-498c-99c5-6538e9a62e0e [Thermothielavioides terrestris]